MYMYGSGVKRTPASNDLVRIYNRFQREQTSPLLHVFENTLQGEKCTNYVLKAGNLVESFVGGRTVLVDAAGLGAAAHRVRLFRTNF